MKKYKVPAIAFFSHNNQYGLMKNEPRHEKTCLRGLRPGKAQTSLRSHSDYLHSSYLGHSGIAG